MIYFLQYFVYFITMIFVTSAICFFVFHGLKDFLYIFKYIRLFIKLRRRVFKLRKKLISITLSIMLIFNFISVQYVSANEATEILKTVTVDGVAIGAGALGGAVALLAVLGVYVASENDACRKIAVDFYNYCDAINRQALVDMKHYYNLVSDSLYTKAQNFVNSTHQVGSNIRRAINFNIGSNGVVTPFNATSAYISPIDGSTLISCDGIKITFFNGGPLVRDYTGTKNLPVSISGLRGTPSWWTSSQRVVNGELCNIQMYSAEYNVVDSTGKVINWHQVIKSYSIPVTQPIPSTGVPVMQEQDYYDYTRSGVTVPLPKTANGDRVICVPKTVGIEGVEVTGDMCVPVPNTIPADIADQIIEYPETVEGEEPAENLPRIDYPKMSIPPRLGLTRKFPFSIPWDLRNAFTSLVAERKCPHWEINFDSMHFVGGGKIVIDFEQFDLWAKIIRWGELIAFNIVLIKITRKIIGA